MLQLNFSPFPQLATKRLVLRQLTVADADAIAALRSNAIVNKYLGRSKTTSPAEAIQFIDKINTAISNNTSLYWVIVLQENNEMVGTICLWNIIIEDDSAEIGYELDPNFHGRGIMQEAIQAVIDFAFNTMQVNVITAFTVPDNIASAKLLEKNNFKLDVAGKYSTENDEGNIIYVLEKIKF